MYEAAGGIGGLLRLAQAWHARVMADEEVSHAFSHGYRPDHSERLAAYWAEALAGAIFKQVWKVALSDDDAPKATDADRSWREVLLAAAMQGAIFGLVKAAVDRGAAEGTRKVTGAWPGDEASRKA